MAVVLKLNLGRGQFQAQLAVWGISRAVVSNQKSLWHNG